MKVAILEKTLGYEFKDRKLIERALTHRSRAHEQFPGGSEAEIRALDNETMEFVGDSVLGLAIAEELFTRNPDMTEGELTLMKHRLVSMETLAVVADSLEIGRHMRIGRGEERTGGREKRALLADTLEAIFAAVFMDAGYETAREVIKAVFADQLQAASPKGSLDYKSLLQETLQATKLRAPTYTLLGNDGPPHERTFFVEAVWEGGSARGKGRSIKSAEMAAAAEALRMMEEAE